ncbi:hypothetical protein XarzCFBP7410_15005 [Xanthomonas arboricola pv. zantedeschiae]|nr:hypothetical protein XarjCFBP7652_09740 [Xanthomonas arboricola]PPT82620.1 hypothetical protein XarzCFBP7410_15005 [Xanthomonas arboricola pv. zantedeschiae]
MRVWVLQAPPSTPSVSGFGQGVSAAGDRLFGSADILSDSPSRHIRVPLSANPRPRCRLGTLLPRLRKVLNAVMTKLPEAPLPSGRGGTACAPWRACQGAPAPQARAWARSGG